MYCELFIDLKLKHFAGSKSKMPRGRGGRGGHGGRHHAHSHKHDAPRHQGKGKGKGSSICMSRNPWPTQPFILHDLSHFSFVCNVCIVGLSPGAVTDGAGGQKPPVEEERQIGQATAARKQSQHHGQIEQQQMAQPNVANQVKNQSLVNCKKDENKTQIIRMKLKDKLHKFKKIIKIKKWFEIVKSCVLNFSLFGLCLFCFWIESYDCYSGSNYNDEIEGQPGSNADVNGNENNNPHHHGGTNFEHIHYPQKRNVDDHVSASASQQETQPGQQQFETLEEEQYQQPGAAKPSYHAQTQGQASSSDIICYPDLKLKVLKPKTQDVQAKQREGNNNGEYKCDHDVNVSKLTPITCSKSGAIMVGAQLNEEDISIRCEIDFIKGIRISFDNTPDINAIHCPFDKNVANDFINNSNYFWNNIHFYDCFEKSIKHAMQKYYEYTHKTSGEGSSSNNNHSKSGSNNNNDSNKDNGSESGNGNTSQNDNKSHNNEDNDEDEDEDDNNGDEGEDNDEKNGGNDNKKQETRKMREIMNLRGVCHCSGDCGNTLIKGSILFYKNILDGNLLLNLIDETKHLQLYNHIFWPHLFKYCFDNDEKREYLADIICFVEQMWKTVPVLGKCLGIEHLISKHRWLDEKNEDQWQQVLLSVIRDSKQPQRTNKIHHWVKIVFVIYFPNNCLN